MTCRRSILAALIGTTLEWFDYGLFAYFSTVFSQLFFPHQNSIIGTLQVFSVFALGYILRPFGAIIFGHIADRYGRRPALRMSIFLISIPSIVISVLPTYQQMGLYAPLLLILMRMMQGFSIGGEFSGAMVYLNELAPRQYRCLVSSLSNNASNIGMLLGVGGASVLAHILSAETFNQYGWRIIFFIAGLLGGLGAILRKNFMESPLYEKLGIADIAHIPVKVLWCDYRRLLFIAMGLCCLGAVNDYTLSVYLSSYLQTIKKFTLADALALQSYFLLFSLIGIPLAGMFADKVGAKKVLAIAVIGHLIFALPAFYFLGSTWWGIFLMLFPLLLLSCCEQGATPFLLAQCFPTTVRYSGVSIAYNIVFSYLGGTSPLYMSYLVDKTHCLWIPGLCLLIAAMMTGIALIVIFLRKEVNFNE